MNRNLEPSLSRRVLAGTALVLAGAVALGGCTRPTSEAAPQPQGADITQDYVENVPLPPNIDEAIDATVRVQTVKNYPKYTYTTWGAGTALAFGGNGWTDVITAAHVVANDNSDCNGTTIKFPAGHWRVSPTNRSSYTSGASLQSPVAPLLSERFNPGYNGGDDTAVVEPDDTSYTNTLVAQQHVSLKVGDFIWAIAAAPADPTPLPVPGQIVEENNHGQFSFITGFREQHDEDFLQEGDSGGTIVSDTDGDMEYDGDLIAGYVTTKGAVKMYTGKQVEGLFSITLPASYLKRLFAISTGQMVDASKLSNLRAAATVCSN